MKNEVFIYNFLLCTFFLLLNLNKVGLKNKSIILPSTILSGMWAITSLGVFLFSNGVIDNVYANYYTTATKLSDIGWYQLDIFIAIFIAFIFARLKYSNLRHVSFGSVFQQTQINSVLDKLKWVLWIYFLVGIVRLVMVVSTIGVVNYALIRDSYISTRNSFSSFDIWLIRVGSYLMYAAYFYVALFGVKSAMYGIKLRDVVKKFLLFAPFQLSFGGRLFILSFFIPFLLSYLIVRTIYKDNTHKKEDNGKLIAIASTGVFLVISLAVLKQGLELNFSTLGEFSADIFYSASSYHFMNELWLEMPTHPGLGYGCYSLGLTNSFIDYTVQMWDSTGNNAIMATPSMIPHMYLDFGRYGSVLMFFILFYIIESKAIKYMSKPNFKSILIVLLLCVFCFNSSTSSMADCMKSLIIGIFLVWIIDKRLIKS